MKFIVPGPGGLLENVINLVGFENLCFMFFEDEDLVKDIFDCVGLRLLRFYEKCSQIEQVGALIVNDDWGFKTQTMFDPDTLRKYVFPWHKRMLEAIHNEQKPAILHSCGNLSTIMDDIIDDLKYDAKHSFEDIIVPVEKAYEEWGDRIAILGGMDMDFLARQTPHEIAKRAEALLTQTGCKGYALGSGNSIPAYIPVENYLAMIQSV
jgi:uroporphyrinogen decarboxylase